MWNPRRFLRNLFLSSFVAVLAFLFLNDALGAFVAVAALFFAPVGLSALGEGRKLGAITDAIPMPADIWRASRGMAEVYLTFMVIASALMALITTDFRIWLGRTEMVVILTFYGATTLIAFVIIRWSYAWGVLQALNQRNDNTG